MGNVVMFKHPDTSQETEGVIAKVNDLSSYTVGKCSKFSFLYLVFLFVCVRTHLYSENLNTHHIACNAIKETSCQGSEDTSLFCMLLVTGKFARCEFSLWFLPQGNKNHD